MPMADHCRPILSIVSAQDAVSAIWQTITSIVHTLLDGADARRWWSVHRQLDLFAEAAPAVFLSGAAAIGGRERQPDGAALQRAGQSADRRDHQDLYPPAARRARSGALLDHDGGSPPDEAAATVQPHDYAPLLLRFSMLVTAGSAEGR